MIRDVLIVGAGPVGLTLAHLLDQYGLRVAVIERGTAPLARLGAVSVDDECLRIWQACGLARELATTWASGEDGQIICRYSDPQGRDFLRLRQRYSDLGHPHAAVIDLDHATRILWHEAMISGRIQIFQGSEFESLKQHASAVDVRIRSSRGSQLHTAQWVVACDGAGSAVRTFLGIEMRTKDLPQPWLVANVSHSGNDQCVHIHCNSKNSSVSVPLPGNRRRIEMMLSQSMRSEPLERADALELLSRVCPVDSGMELHDYAIMRFRAGMAEHWRCGRTFLAGDAAHVTPPFASQGLATGLRDASNLAFKLAGVTQGWLPQSALDTYEAERRSHQHRMITLALRLGWLMSPPSKLIGHVAHTGIRVATRIPSLRGRFEMRGPSLRPVYRSSLVGKGRRAGRYLPQPRVVIRDGRHVPLDSLLGPRMSWLQLARGNEPIDPDNLRLASGDVLLVEGRDFADPAAILQSRFGAGALVLIRPDRIVHSHAIYPNASEGRKSPWGSRLESLPA